MNIFTLGIRLFLLPSFCMASSRAMNGVGDPSLVRDTMETIKAIFGDNILLVDYKNDIGKEALQESLKPLIQDGVISILEMSENYENTVNRRLSKKDKKPKKTKPPTLPYKTYTATNIKYELEGVSKCEDSCTRIFKNALEDHTDEYFSTNPDIRLVRNTVTVTCLLYTSPSPRDGLLSRMPSSA